MSEEVEAWMAAYENPQKSLVQKVREAILAADPRIGETIKWSTPTFAYKGNLASFNPRSKAHVSLLFHSGAKIEGEFPSLEGEGGMARTLKVRDEADLKAKSAEIKRVVKAWCDQRDAG